MQQQKNNAPIAPFIFQNSIGNKFLRVPISFISIRKYTEKNKQKRNNVTDDRHQGIENVKWVEILFYYSNAIRCHVTILDRQIHWKHITYIPTLTQQIYRVLLFRLFGPRKIVFGQKALRTKVTYEIFFFLSGRKLFRWMNSSMTKVISICQM